MHLTPSKPPKAKHSHIFAITLKCHFNTIENNHDDQKKSDRTALQLTSNFKVYQKTKPSSKKCAPAVLSNFQKTYHYMTESNVHGYLVRMWSTVHQNLAKTKSGMLWTHSWVPHIDTSTNCDIFTSSTTDTKQVMDWRTSQHYCLTLTLPSSWPYKNN